MEARTKKDTTLVKRITIAWRSDTQSRNHHLMKKITNLLNIYVCVRVRVHMHTTNVIFLTNIKIINSYKL